MADDTEDIEFDPQVPVSRLPENWSVTVPYDTSVRLNSPEGQAEHVLLQYWGTEDGESQYLVQAMVASPSASGTSATNDPSKQLITPDLDEAANYAIEAANDIA